MNNYETIKKELQNEPKKWLVTGVAGFIGSHLAESLLALGQNVVGLDDLSMGHQSNLADFKDSPQFSFIKGDIRDQEICVKACSGVDYVLHHAAIGSVVKSLENPAFVDSVNNGGFVNVLQAAENAGVKRVVYASSSAVYGDAVGDKRYEEDALCPLSPYAETKQANELYAENFTGTHAVSAVGLRYFNIYGPRQDPNGAYAAVIPKWINQMIAENVIEIYGDGETVRDFCFVGDVVKANILAALVLQEEKSPVYNIGGGKGVSLNELFKYLKTLSGYSADPAYKEFREADIRISCADISKARDSLGFEPKVDFEEGLGQTVTHYKKQS